uniref:uncharacterized protein LOC124064969 n=1 Tax=Scatophagus argus TaxID=75038 RepID=UPI001ED80FD7|nr:uncharacterized protein LOC124064969 [Scatophagus argus]
MITSRMKMQKSFTLLLMIWNSCFASGNTATNHLQFSLGCRVVIPCRLYRSDSNSLKWFYKKDERSGSIRIFFQDKKGLPYYHRPLNPRIKVWHNGSLVIDHLREDDEGRYWCENCFQDSCQNKDYRVISVKQEIPTETKTSYVKEGSNFTHACVGGLTNIWWTFKTSNTTALWSSAQKPESDFVNSNKSVHIVNVKREDAGKYSCWTSGCDGHGQKLLTINLCVITVHHHEDSSVSCVVTCDTKFSNIKSNNASDVETDAKTVSVDQHRFLNCSRKQMFDGYSTADSTRSPSNVFSKTTGASTGPKYPILLYGTSAAVTCLVFVALLICLYLRSTLQAAFPVRLFSSDLNDGAEEEGTAVVYSSLVIRPTKTENCDKPCTDCVYSEIYMEGVH